MSLIRHVDGFRVNPNACWFLTASEVSSISPEDLSVFGHDFIGSHIYLLLCTRFEPCFDTHNFSFAKGEGGGGGGEFLH